MCWSSTRIFHTGGPVAAGPLLIDGAFVATADTLEEGSMELLRLRSVSRAFVCACCSVGGAAVAWDNQQVSDVHNGAVTTC